MTSSSKEPYPILPDFSSELDKPDDYAPRRIDDSAENTTMLATVIDLAKYHD